MHTAVPTDRKKTVPSVLTIASRLFCVRRATCMPSTRAKASSTTDAPTTQASASALADAANLGVRPRRRRQQAEAAVDHRQDHRRQQIFLGVAADAQHLAEDELLRRQVGHQQQVEGAGVALRRDRRHRLGADQQQAQHAGQHQAEDGGRAEVLAAAPQRRQGVVADQPQHDEIGRLDQEGPAAVGAAWPPRARGSGWPRPCRTVPGAAWAFVRSFSSASASSGLSRCMIGSPLGFHSRRQRMPQPLRIAPSSSITPAQP